MTGKQGGGAGAGDGGLACLRDSGQLCLQEVPLLAGPSRLDRLMA